MQSEPTHVSAVANAMIAGCRSDGLRSLLIQSRDQYKRQAKHGGIKLIVNDNEFTVHRVLDLWINGVYFHNDTRKRQALEAMGALQALGRHAFLDAVVVTTQYVGYLQRALYTGRSTGTIT